MNQKPDQETEVPFTGALPIDSLPLPVIVISHKRKLIAANQMARRIFDGFDLGKDLSAMIRYPEFLEACARVFETGETLECEVVRTGRRRRTFQASISPFQSEEHQGAFVILYETTAASDAEKLRSSFVADVSHELRSPLTTLMATIETLKGRAGEDETTRTRFIDLMAHETERMHRIVNDLLSLSATEAQEHIAPDDTVNLGRIIEDIVDVLSEEARKKGISLVVSIDDDLQDIQGDYHQLYQVVHNLVDNAIKYGDPDSSVTIRAEGGDGIIGISVNNVGTPIAEDHIPRLTERFYRIDKSRSRELGGTGLGLAIVKHIVNRHLGKLTIKSNQADGTTFTIHLPAKVAVG